MSTAICKSCGRETVWHATRGAKLSGIRCQCGGDLRSKTAGVASSSSGKHFQVCDYCGRKRLETKLVSLVEPTWFIGARLERGSRVCRWHELAEDGGLRYQTPLVEVAQHQRNLAAASLPAPEDRPQ